MRRVAVIGNAAGRKSVMCKALSKSKGLPVHAVDKIQWKPGWTSSPEVEVEEKLNEIDETVLPGTAWIDIDRLDLFVGQPLLHLMSDEWLRMSSLRSSEHCYCHYGYSWELPLLKWPR